MDKEQKFGLKFKAWREKMGVSNYKIEKLTGYSRGNLSNLEAGKLVPSDELISLLASVPELGLSAQKMYAWKLMDEYGADAIMSAVEEIKTAHPEMFDFLDNGSSPE